jgi:hypothetical protein
MPEPANPMLDEVKRLYADARNTFEVDLFRWMRDVHIFAASLSRALGEISPIEARMALRKFLLEKFDEQVLGVHPPSEPKEPKV